MKRIEAGTPELEPAITGSEAQVLGRVLEAAGLSEGAATKRIAEWTIHRWPYRLAAEEAVRTWCDSSAGRRVIGVATAKACLADADKGDGYAVGLRRLFVGLRTFDPHKGAFDGWAYTVLVRAMRTVAATSTRHAGGALPDDDTLGSETRELESIDSASYVAYVLREADRLDPQWSPILRAYVTDGRSLRSLALESDTPYTTFVRHFGKFCTRLARVLKSKEKE